MSAVVPPGLPGSLWVVSASCPTTEVSLLTCSVCQRWYRRASHIANTPSGQIQPPPPMEFHSGTPWGRDGLSTSEAVNTPEQPPASQLVIWGMGPGGLRPPVLAAPCGSAPPVGLVGFPRPPFPFPFTSGRASANLSPNMISEEPKQEF